VEKTNDTADVQIRNIDLHYGSLHVLKNINLDICGGEFFAFLGPSGCGKTSLLRLIAGFNTPTNGSVVIAGRDVVNLPPWKRDVGMVFQSYALWPHMTIWKNVAFGLEERRLPKHEVSRRVDVALKLVGMDHLGSRRPSQLSGGQQQRVALARTIAIEPKVLLLDEPLSNLDAALRVQVRRELLSMQRRLGLTTIFVTHDQEEANSICDRIAIFKDGVVQQVGRPVEIYDDPKNLFVAGFLGAANIVAGNVSDNKGSPELHLIGGDRVAIDKNKAANECKAFFRPQHSQLVVGKPKGDGRDIYIPGKIVHREFLGPTIRYGVRIENGEVLSADMSHDGNDLADLNAVTGIRVARNRVSVLAE
jgi:iron(III) transport system ATP-binding protein